MRHWPLWTERIEWDRETPPQRHGRVDIAAGLEQDAEALGVLYRISRREPVRLNATEGGRVALLVRADQVPN